MLMRIRIYITHDDLGDCADNSLLQKQGNSILSRNATSDEDEACKYTQRARYNKLHTLMVVLYTHTISRTNVCY